MKLKVQIKKTVLALFDFPYLPGQKLECQKGNTIFIDLDSQNDITKKQERFLEDNDGVVSYRITER